MHVTSPAEPGAHGILHKAIWPDAEFGPVQGGPTYFAGLNQVEALDLGLLTQRCLCAVRAGDVAAVARTLSPELVNLRVTRDPTSGNLVVAATSVPGTQRSSELPLTPSLNPAS